MSDSKQQPITGKNQNATNPPTHVAYHVRDTKNGKGFWAQIGSAWAHKDGKVFNLQIDVVPLDGRITLRAPEEKTSQ